MAQHQALLRVIVDYYGSDPRILAVLVFGSLGRDKYDEYSDLDLDFVIGDEVQINPVQEFEHLAEAFQKIGEKAAIIIPDGDQAADMVLESLMQLSARYHPLAQTSPNIVESLHLLTGSLSAATIAAAGAANSRKTRSPIDQSIDQYLRYAAVAQVCLLRERHWLTIDLLHRMRGLLMEIFSHIHRGIRAHQTFEEDASQRLQARLGATLPQYDLASLRHSLEQLLVFLEEESETLSNGQTTLTSSQQMVIHQIRQRFMSNESRT